MDAGRGLAEEGHDDGVGGVGAGQFHVVGFLVGRNALQDELSGVGVFAFVAFEGHVAQPDANGKNKEDCQPDQKPGRVATQKLG